MEIQIQESYFRLFLRFLRFGLLAWGGPVAQIAMMRKELVEEEKWISSEQFNRVLALYQALPGPEATELCIYFGMKVKGRVGGIIAGLAFMFPGFLLMLLLTAFYLSFGIEDPVIKSVFSGIHAGVIALIVAAVHRLGKHSATNSPLIVVMLVSAILFIYLPFYVVLPVAGICYSLHLKRRYVASGLLAGLVIVCAFLFPMEKSEFVSENIRNDKTENSDISQVVISGLKAGSLTFGGAYTAIPFVREDAVERFGWMDDKQFLDGLALSGVLPAPLIIFSTFVGWFAAGWLGAILITIAVFAPAFIITLAGHTYFEKLLALKPLHDFLDGITASVIGLIGLTAISLFRSTIVSVESLIIFTIAVILLYTLKSRFTSIVVIVVAGVCGYLIMNYFK